MATPSVTTRHDVGEAAERRSWLRAPPHEWLACPLAARLRGVGRGACMGSFTRSLRRFGLRLAARKPELNT